MIERGSTNRLTLRFDSESLEAEYFDCEFTRNLFKIRCAILLAIVMYLGFGYIDLLLVPELVSQIWTMRAVIGCVLVS